MSASVNQKSHTPTADKNKTCFVLLRFLISFCCLGGCDFYYSEIANFGLWIDCNTFLDIFGNFKVLTKYGPSGPLVITEIL